MKVLDLFSGIGGFSLGLESTGHYETIGFCEIEPFCREVLAHHWPGVPIWEDVRELTAESLGGLRPDAIVGGFPCQDISVAGKGEGIDGARSGLWSEFARLVGEIGPRWVLAENVGALRTQGIDRVCSDLEAEGYAVWPLVVGAWAVGAPHRRERVWIVAHRSSDPLREQPRGRSGESGSGEAEPRGGCASVADEHGPGLSIQRGRWILDGERETSRDDADGRGQRPVGSPTGAGLEGQRADAGRPQEPQPGDASPRWPARPGEPQHEWEEPRLAYGERSGRDGREASAEGQHGDGKATGWVQGERGVENGHRCDGGSPPRSSQLPVGSNFDGLPERLARRWNRESLKALGNSVVPQVVAAIGQAIFEANP